MVEMKKETGMLSSRKGKGGGALIQEGDLS